jgi:chromate reductase
VEAPIKILGIAGSLRARSLNRALLQAAVGLMPEGVELEIFDIAALPLFNSDLEEDGPPARVAQLREAVVACDALLIATPEYNFSIPGVLKNALDWMSRGIVPPCSGKALGIIGASLSVLGTCRAQVHLRQIAVYLDLHPVNRPEVFVGDARQKFDQHLNLIDEPSREILRQHLHALTAWTRKLR